MNDKPIIRLTALQVGEVYLDRLVEFFQRGVKPEEALTKILQALAKDVAEQRELAQEALSEMAKYVHPKTGAGIIADKNERMRRYEEEGLRDAIEKAELEAVPTEQRKASQKKRLTQLADELMKDAANVRSVQQSLDTDQVNYTRWQERYDERLARLKVLKADFEALQDEGPALIAQIKDAQRADEARKRDEASQVGTATGQAAEGMLENLRGQAEQAGRLEEAGRLLEEELKGEPSLDEELAARNEASAQDDLIQGWMSKVKGS